MRELVLNNRTLDMTFPEWAKPLLKPARFKVIYGGRGSGKSFTVADFLLLKSMEKRGTILCVREFQESIGISVYSMLKERIAYWKLQRYFKVLKNQIICRITGTDFVFKGMTHNVGSLKSIQNIICAWVEEGAYITKESWIALVPSVRGKDAEVIVTFNPLNKTDVVYQEFVVNTPPDNAWVQKLSYRDNPFENKVLDGDRANDLLRKDADLYNHIWEGECLEHSDAQIFKNKWIVGEFDEPKNVHKYFGLDFGFNDPVAAIACYVHEGKLYISHEAVKTKLDIDKIKPFIEKMIPDLGKHTIYADCANPEQISYLKKQGMSIKPVSKGKGSIEDGIAYIRSFDKVVINKRCKHTINEFLKYSYKVDPRSGDIMDIIVDKDNHCIDSIRYGLERSMKRKGCSYKNWDMDALRQVQGL
jgi:phage terminase large subunit